MNFYNEIDPFAAAWLRELIKAGQIAPGVVDERSIEDIEPNELKQYTQCHFFAGIGVWSYALRQAGWPDDKPVWTGSCPCQPFSSAGEGGGFTDERHLWPAWFHLIEANRPSAVFGEQVDAAIRQGWLDLVQTDLEGIGYSFGPVGLPACGFGAPHIRQRIYFVAYAESLGHERFGQARNGRAGLEDGGYASHVGNSEYAGLEGFPRHGSSSEGRAETIGPIAAPSNPSNFWRECGWVPCKDGKARPIEPGTFPLAHGAAARVGRLRGYGNAIVAPVAEAFIRAFIESEEE